MVGGLDDLVDSSDDDDTLFGASAVNVPVRLGKQDRSRPMETFQGAVADTRRVGHVSPGGLSNGDVPTTPESVRGITGGQSSSTSSDRLEGDHGNGDAAVSSPTVPFPASPAKKRGIRGLSEAFDDFDESTGLDFNVRRGSGGSKRAPGAQNERKRSADQRSRWGWLPWMRQRDGNGQATNQSGDYGGGDVRAALMDERRWRLYWSRLVSDVLGGVRLWGEHVDVSVPLGAQLAQIVILVAMCLPPWIAMRVVFGMAVNDALCEGANDASLIRNVWMTVGVAAGLCFAVVGIVSTLVRLALRRKQTAVAPADEEGNCDDVETLSLEGGGRWSIFKRSVWEYAAPNLGKGTLSKRVFHSMLAAAVSASAALLFAVNTIASANECEGHELANLTYSSTFFSATNVMTLISAGASIYALVIRSPPSPNGYFSLSSSDMASAYSRALVVVLSVAVPVAARALMMVDEAGIDALQQGIVPTSMNLRASSVIMLVHPVYVAYGTMPSPRSLFMYVTERIQIILFGGSAFSTLGQPWVASTRTVFALVIAGIIHQGADHAWTVLEVGPLSADGELRTIARGVWFIVAFLAAWLFVQHGPWFSDPVDESSVGKKKRGVIVTMLANALGVDVPANDFAKLPSLSHAPRDVWNALFHTTVAPSKGAVKNAKAGIEAIVAEEAQARLQRIYANVIGLAAAGAYMAGMAAGSTSELQHLEEDLRSAWVHRSLGTSIVLILAVLFLMEAKRPFFLVFLLRNASFLKGLTGGRVNQSRLATIADRLSMLADEGRGQHVDVDGIVHAELAPAQAEAMMIANECGLMWGRPLVSAKFSSLLTILRRVIIPLVTPFLYGALSAAPSVSPSLVAAKASYWRVFLVVCGVIRVVNGAATAASEAGGVLELLFVSIFLLVDEEVVHGMYVGVLGICVGAVLNAVNPFVHALVMVGRAHWALFSEKLAPFNVTAGVRRLACVAFGCTVGVVTVISCAIAALLGCVPRLFLGFPVVLPFPKLAPSLSVKESYCRLIDRVSGRRARVVVGLDGSLYKPLMKSIAKTVRQLSASGAVGGLRGLLPGQVLLMKAETQCLFVEILERFPGDQYVINVRGMELTETSCHEVERRQLEDQFGDALDGQSCHDGDLDSEAGGSSGATNVPSRFNNLWYSAVQPRCSVAVQGYSASSFQMDVALSTNEFHDAFGKCFMQCLLTVMDDVVGSDTELSNIRPGDGGRDRDLVNIGHHMLQTFAPSDWKDVNVVCEGGMIPEATGQRVATACLASWALAATLGGSTEHERGHGPLTVDRITKLYGGSYTTSAAGAVGATSWMNRQSGMALSGKSVDEHGSVRTFVSHVLTAFRAAVHVALDVASYVLELSDEQAVREAVERTCNTDLYHLSSTPLSLGSVNRGTGDGVGAGSLAYAPRVRCIPLEDGVPHARSLASTGVPGRQLATAMHVDRSLLRCDVASVMRTVFYAHWDVLAYELLFVANDDDERRNIQADSLTLRNLASAASPLGYPVFVSGAVLTA